jgi:FKBP-type peptidyl-prolyl cis-trans isomerase FkpA
MEAPSRPAPERLVNVRLALVLALAACGQQPATPAPAPSDAPAPAAAAPAPAGAVTLQTDDDKTLYALGQTLGRSLGPFQLTPDELKKVEAGLEDFAGGKPSQVDLDTYGPRIQSLAETRSAAAAAGNADKSKAFLAQIAASPGATTLPSGVVYVEVQPGKGKSPTAQDTVRVNYRGTLADGTEFDSSYKRGQPAEFPLGRVIPCWTEGIQKMKVGGKAKLGCPADLAYGDQGAGEIPPGAALQFEVELLDIAH